MSEISEAIKGAVSKVPYESGLRTLAGNLVSISYLTEMGSAVGIIHPLDDYDDPEVCVWDMEDGMTDSGQEEKYLRVADGPEVVTRWLVAVRSVDGKVAVLMFNNFEEAKTYTNIKRKGGVFMCRKRVDLTEGIWDEL